MRGVWLRVALAAGAGLASLVVCSGVLVAIVWLFFNTTSSSGWLLAKLRECKTRSCYMRRWSTGSRERPGILAGSYPKTDGVLYEPRRPLYNSLIEGPPFSPSSPAVLFLCSQLRPTA